MKRAPYNLPYLTSLEELRQVPRNSVLMDCHGAAWQRLGGYWWCVAMASMPGKTHEELWASFGRIRKHLRLAVAYRAPE